MSSASTGQLDSFLSFKSTPEVEVDSLQLQKEQPTSISEKSLSPHAKAESPMIDGIFDTKVNFSSIDDKLDQSKINPDETIQNEIDQVIKETENLEKEAESQESSKQQQQTIEENLNSQVKKEVHTPERHKEPLTIQQQEENIKSTADDISKVSAYARLEFENFIFYVQTLQVVLGRKSENDQSHSVDVHLGDSKAISRKHAKIFYNFGTERFELSIQGKNGAFVDDVFIERGATVPLTNKSKVQIGQIVFRFVLPGMNPQENLESPSKPINPSDAISLRSSLYHHSSSENVGEKSGSNTPGLSSKDFEPVAKVENETTEATEQVKKAKEKKQPRPPKPPKKVYTIDEIPEEYRTKPACSYSNLIATCLRTHGTSKGMSLAEIYKSIKELFPYYKYCPDGWQSSVRHNLSLNKAFRKVSKEGKGWLWGLDEEYCAEKDRLKKKQAAAAAAKAKAAALKLEQQQLQQQKLQQQRLEQQKQSEQNINQQQSVPNTLSLPNNLQQPQGLQNLPLQPPPALQQPSLAQNQVKVNTTSSQSPLQSQSQINNTPSVPFANNQKQQPSQNAPSSISIQQFQQQPVANVTNARPTVPATSSYTTPQQSPSIAAPKPQGVTQQHKQQQRPQQGQQQNNQYNSTPQAPKQQLQQPVPLPPSTLPLQQQNPPPQPQPQQQFKPSSQLQSPAPQFQNKTPSIQAQLAANRGISSQPSRTLSQPPPPPPQVPKPPPTGLTADTKKALAHLQQQLVILSKDLKTLVDRPTISAILTQAIAMTIAQVTQAAKTKGITSDPLATLIETNPQQLTRILTVALNAATFKVTNGRIKAPLKVSQSTSSAGNSRAGTPNPVQQSPSPRTSSPNVANIPIQPIHKQTTPAVPSPIQQKRTYTPPAQQQRAYTPQPQPQPQAQQQKPYTPQPQATHTSSPQIQQQVGMHQPPVQPKVQLQPQSQSQQYTQAPATQGYQGLQNQKSRVQSSNLKAPVHSPAPSQQHIHKPVQQQSTSQPKHAVQPASQAHLASTSSQNQGVIQPQPVKTQSSNLVSSFNKPNVISTPQTQPSTPNAPKVQPLPRSASSLSSVQPQTSQNLSSQPLNTQVPSATQSQSTQSLTNNGALAQFQNNNSIQQAQTEPSTPIARKIEPIVSHASNPVDINRPASQPNANALFSGNMSVDDVSRLVTGDSTNLLSEQHQTQSEIQNLPNDVSANFDQQSIKLEKGPEPKSNTINDNKTNQLGAPNVVVKQERVENSNSSQTGQKVSRPDLSFGKPVIESTPHVQNSGSEAPDLSFLDEDEEFNKVLKSFSKEGTPAIEENDAVMDQEELNRLLSSDFTQAYETETSKKRSFEEESDMSTGNAHTDKAARHE
ncbi:Pre-rRNA-processing protein [Wickerhamomyces ciferrii]|uniref:Pre-rRNA-processing protein n=1 Tax=Wickerhamomyces ciferrii (strain ATCC 14091 / BCRC 22168 / CBS 111 / JCM 3599 / NBRC 0793 / NRRL Y-1031 F-60-10) TaxID=1206466 RepID=K0KIM2_WICCF|nr:Pre-rRNA-processing protein [Wickerhamomyces ciferrii]CCH41234.1 Pre-rRNA-processing protein [Wickerhamomyces ciferrii]